MNPDIITRRAFLGCGGLSLGAAALGTLLGGSPHLAPRARRVIHLCMAGGPSHLETFDPKPDLARLDGEPMPESFTRGQQLAQLQGSRDGLRCLSPQFPFRRFGRSGLPVSEAFPQIGSIADDIAVVRSMHTEQINHDPAHTFMNTGSVVPGRPSMGSWLLYGLGADTDSLPGYVVLVSSGGGQDQPISARQWSAGFLPSRFQGVAFQSAGDPVHYVGNPPGVTRGDQGALVGAVNDLNLHLAQGRHDPEIATRVAAYEMAFRMQASVPGLTDMSAEPQHVLDLYGVGRPGDGSFASNCLLARRLAERGVRFIQLYHRGWDHHGEIRRGIATTSGLVDRATAALVTDLKQRGMLDDTLVIWGGEFGRTPMAQGSGRDHHIKAFSVWLAGAGVRGGTVFGATDELGYAVTENPVSVHDLHATMLHLLGVDHERLTYKFQGLDFKLTGVEPAKVVREVLV